MEWKMKHLDVEMNAAVRYGTHVRLDVNASKVLTPQDDRRLPRMIGSQLMQPGTSLPPRRESRAQYHMVQEPDDCV